VFSGITFYVEDAQSERRRMCDAPQTGCPLRITSICMWREQAVIIEWARRVIY